MTLEITVIAFLVLLITREIAGASHSERAQRMAKFLIVPITPLLMLFVFLAVSRVIDIAS